MDGFAKIDFRSLHLRRMSSLGTGKRTSLVGHLLYRAETKAKAFFILGHQCRYRARLDIGYLDSLIVV